VDSALPRAVRCDAISDPAGTVIFVSRSVTLQSFLPRLVAESIRAGDPIPCEPVGREHEGTVLFADISGFTRMVLERANAGAAGAEEIGSLLNEWFTAMIGEVERHGGDVLAFDGDAIIAFWRLSGETLAGTARAAYRCGEAMLEAVEKRGRLAVKVGLATGKVHWMRLGGHDGRWLVVASGSPLSRMGRGARAAGAGRIACDENTIRHLRKSEELDTARRVVTAGELPPNLVADYLPRVLVERIAAGQGAWLAELRTVSAVFVIIRGLDADVREDRASLGAATLAVQRRVAHLQGDVNQLLQDDTGHVFLLAFGLPSRSHENDAERATRAALLIHEDLEVMGVLHSIGVATGPAYCGVYGSASRRHYAIVGDCINLAARLAQAGRHGPLCDESTANAAARAIAFEPAEPVSAKGRPNAVCVWCPATRPADLSAPTLGLGTSVVGRVAELAFLRGHLLPNADAALRGTSIVVSGEAGIGKSTLMSLMVQSLEAARVRVFNGRGIAIEHARAWHAWQPIVLQLLGARDRPAKELATRATQAIGSLPGVGDWVPLLNTLLPLDLPDSQSTARMTGAVRRGALTELLLAWFRVESAKRPSVVVIDDAHWADEDSWDLARRVVESVPGMQLVLLTRPMGLEAPAAYAELHASGAVASLRLPPLVAADVEAVVTRALAVSEVPREVATFVFAKGQGNPFLSRELALALRDTGHLEIRDGKCKLVDPTRRLQDLGMPGTVLGVITQRLDRLGSVQLLALKVGAVIGPSFTEDTLSQIYPVAISELDLAVALRDLIALDFIHRPAPEHHAYAFNHAIVQDAVYGLIPFAQRRALHAEVATLLEKNGSGSVPDSYATLAHHWRCAGAADRAVAYLDKAGDLALTRGANREVVALFQEALELSSAATTSRRQLAHRNAQLGKGYYGLGQLELSRRHIDRALELLQLPMPRSELGWIARTVTETLGQVWRLASPFPKRSAKPEVQSREREAAELISVLGEQYFFLVQMHRMVTAELCAINLAEKAGAAEVASRPYGALGYLVGVGRGHALAEEYFKRGKRGGDARAIATTHVAEALYHLTYARWSRCFEVVDAGLSVAGEVADRFSRELLLNVRADAQHASGDTGAALKSYDELLLLSRAEHSGQHEVWALTGTAEVLSNLGQPREAMRHLEAIATRLEHADKLSHIRYLGVRALVEVRLGQTESAAATLDEMLAHRKVHPQLAYAMVWGMLGGAQAAFELCERDPSRTTRKRFERLARPCRWFARAYPFARVPTITNYFSWYRST
jgi:class 3 adenylate cyclase/tetratricopeptide (TPR) repeat protein